MASVGRATALLASGTLVSRLLGFGRQWLLVQAIGTTGFVADSFNTASQAPNQIFAIVSQGLLNAVLIPQFVRAAKHKDGGQAYINKLVTLGIVVFAAVTLLGTLLSPQLMHAFGIHPQSFDLAVAFAYWAMPQVFFFGVYTLLGEVLNARGSFGPFTWAPVLNNLVSITTLVIFLVAYGRHPVTDIGEWPALKIAVLSAGFPLGVAAQALILFAFWRRVGLRFRFDFGWRGIELRTVGRAAGWTFAMLLCTQLAGWFQTRVANSATGPHRVGSQGLGTMWLIFMLPYSIIAVSVVTAYFTRMAEHARDNDMASFKTDYSAAVRGNVLLISVCAAVLIVCAGPFARVFSPEFRPLAIVLVMYVIGLVPFVVAFVTLRAFYSLGDTRSPFVYTLVQSLVVVAGLLVCLQLPLGIRAPGIATVVSIAGTVQAVIAMVFLYRRLNGLELGSILMTVARGFAAAVPAFAAGFLVLFLLGGGRIDHGFPVASPFTAIVSMVIIGLAMLLVYAVALAVVRTPELRDFTHGIRRRLRV